MKGVIRLVVVGALAAAMIVVAQRFPLRGWNLAAPTPADAATLGVAGAGTVPVTSAAIICPGPETVGVAKVDSHTAIADTQVRVAAPPATLSGRTSGAEGSITGRALGGSAALGFATRKAPGAGSVALRTARSVLFSGTGRLAAGLSAVQSTVLTSGDARGLSTTACAAPTSDTWLVGSSADTGRQGRIFLSNPTPNAVTVVMQAYGKDGPLASTAGRGIIVGPHKHVVVLLNALAPGEATPVVHVLAHGGRVGVSMSDTWLLGTAPSGSDDIAPTAPGTDLVLPGVFAGPATGETVLRIAATSTAATVHVRLLSASGPIAAPGAAATVQVPALSVRSVDLAGVPGGLYAVQLTSDAPVVAGVQIHPAIVTPLGRQDLAWTTAVPAIGVGHLAGFPLGQTSAPWTEAVALTAAGSDATVDVVSVASDGTETTQPAAVAGGTTTAVRLTTAATSAWIVPRTGSVQAALVTQYTDVFGPMLSVAPLSPLPATTEQVAVHPQAG